MTDQEKKLWVALFWMAMKIDGICPMCSKRMDVSGQIDQEYCLWHLKEAHTELLTVEE